MDANLFLDFFINSILIEGSSSKAYQFLESIKHNNKELYNDIMSIIKEKKDEIDAINKSDSEYVKAREEYLKNYPIDDVQVYVYEARKFDINWVNQKRNSFHNLSK